MFKVEKTREEERRRGGEESREMRGGVTEILLQQRLEHRLEIIILLSSMAGLELVLLELSRAAQLVPNSSFITTVAILSTCIGSFLRGDFHVIAILIRRYSYQKVPSVYIGRYISKKRYLVNEDQARSLTEMFHLIVQVLEGFILFYSSVYLYRINVALAA